MIIDGGTVKNVFITGGALAATWGVWENFTAPQACSALKKEATVRALTNDLREGFCPGVKVDPIDTSLQDARVQLPARVMRVERFSTSAYDQGRVIAGVELSSTDAASAVVSVGYLEVPEMTSVMGRTVNGRRVFDAGGGGIPLDTLGYTVDMLLPIPEQPSGGISDESCTGIFELLTGLAHPTTSCRREGLGGSLLALSPMVGADRDHDTGYRQRVLSEIAVGNDDEGGHNGGLHCLFVAELEPALLGEVPDGTILTAEEQQQRHNQAAAMILATHVRMTAYAADQIHPSLVDVVTSGSFDVGATPAERYEEERRTDDGLPEDYILANDSCVTGTSDVSIPAQVIDVYREVGQPNVSSSYDTSSPAFVAVLEGAALGD